jgi:GMP synthase-like glutamine amidotransferase
LSKLAVKVAIIDLYNNEENQGIRCIKDILNEVDCLYHNINLEYQLFDTRFKGEVPDLEYDIYISSGGPGSPFEVEGMKWEADYFNLLDRIWGYNQNNNSKKHIFFICHSFQIMARFFKFGDVIPRNSKSFGVMPVHLTIAGKKDNLFMGLTDPFYAADFREWQVIQPNKKVFEELGAKLLSIEKERPQVPLERAMMAVRITDEIVGTQFHPEADPASMYYHFRKPDRKGYVISKYGEKKYYEMLELLELEDGIKLTRKTVLPNFIKNALYQLREE